MIYQEDVRLSLKKIKTGKTMGPDKLCAKMVKLYCKQLYKPLHVLFQDSLDQCKVPSLENSEIVPKVTLPPAMNE